MKYQKKVGEFIFEILIGFILIILSINLAPAAEDGTLKWFFEADMPISGSPAVGDDGTIYVGTDSTESFYAINPDGTLKWRFSEADGLFVTSPSIAADGTIFVMHNGLLALNPDGTQKWVFPTGGWISSPPAIGADGTIYMSEYENLYAINPDGTQKWVCPTGVSYDNYSPAIGADGTIYVPGYENLYAINPDGTQKWVCPIGGRIPAIGADGTIYVGTGGGEEEEGEVYALNPDGTQKWVFPGGIPAIGADGTIYTSGYENLYAINPDGTQKWVFPTGVSYDNYSPAIGADGTIYVPGYENLYAINPDGTQKWIFTPESRPNSSPTIIDDGTIYVGAGSGLCAINSSSLGLANSSWPMSMHDARHTGRAVATITSCILDSKFQETHINDGVCFYTDRNYYISEGVPSWMEGRTLIKTPNDERSNDSASGYIRFTTPVGWWVYVLFDSRSADVPDWLNSWERYTKYPDMETSLVTQPSLKMYRKMFDAGECVNLGGNYGPGSSGEYRSNYVVVYGKDGYTNCILDPKFGETDIEVGAEYYTDRTYTITGNVPSWMVGRTLIQTPNDEKKNSLGSGYIRFTTPVSWWVYVLFDSRSADVPDWLNSWERYTKYPDMQTSLATQPSLKMYRKMFDAGECVNLGGNYGPGSSGEYRSNYGVVYGK